MFLKSDMLLSNKRQIVSCHSATMKTTGGDY